MNVTTQPVDTTAELYEALHDLVDRIERTVAPRVDRHGHGPWNAVVTDDTLLVRVCSRCGRAEKAVRGARRNGDCTTPPMVWQEAIQGDGSCGSAPHKVVPR